MEIFRSAIGSLKNKAEHLYNARVQKVKDGIGKERHWNLEMCQGRVRKELMGLLSATGLVMAFPVGYGAMKVAHFIDDLYISDSELIELSQQFHGQLEIPYSVSKTLRMTLQQVTGETMTISRYPAWMQRFRGQSGVVEENLEDWVENNSVVAPFSQIQDIVDAAEKRCNLEEWAKDGKEKGLMFRIDLLFTEFSNKYPFFQNAAILDLKDFLQVPLVFRSELNGQQNEYSFYEFFTRWKKGEVPYDEFLTVMEKTKYNEVSFNDLFARRDTNPVSRMVKNSLGANETYEAREQKKKFLEDFLYLYEKIAREIDVFAEQHKVSSRDVLRFVMTKGIFYEGNLVKTTAQFKLLSENVARKNKQEWMIPKLRCGGGFSTSLSVPETLLAKEQFLAVLYRCFCITGEKTSLTSPELVQATISQWFTEVGVSKDVHNEKLGKAQISCEGNRPIVFEKP